jgi:hypothetical protein
MLAHNASILTASVQPRMADRIRRHRKIDWRRLINSSAFEWSQASSDIWPAVLAGCMRATTDACY